MEKIIFHISHTDIRSDSRILREMSGAKKVGKCKTFGLGFERDNSDYFTNFNTKFEIITKKMFCLKLKFLPSTISYFFEVLELSLYAVYFIIKIKPNIIHCHDVNPLPVVSFLSLFINFKIIYDAHELESNRNRLSKLNGKLVRFVEKLCWSRVTHFITVSDSIVKWYEENFGKKRSTVICNAPIFNADEMLGKIYEDYLREKFSIPDESLIGIYVGLLDLGRGIQNLIQIYKNLDHNFHIVFLGYGELSSDLKNISKEFSNIHFHNKVNHDQVVPIISSADLGFCLIENVSLSDYYSLPNKLFEYVNAGLYVISSDFPEIKSKLYKHKLGKTFDSNLSGLKNFLYKNRVNLMNREDVSCPEEFSWSFHEKNLVALYSELI